MRVYLVKSEADFTTLAIKKYLEEEIMEDKEKPKKQKRRGKSKKNASAEKRSSFDSGFLASGGNSSNSSSFFGKDNSYTGSGSTTEKQKAKPVSVEQEEAPKITEDDIFEACLF